MKLHNTISILFTTLLLCGNAFSKPNNDAPPVEVDVNVVNTPLDVVVVGEQQSESVLLRFRASDSDFAGSNTIFVAFDWTMCVGNSPCDNVSSAPFVVPDNMQLRIRQLGFSGRELLDGTSSSVSARTTIITTDSFGFDVSAGQLDLADPPLSIWEGSDMVDIIAPAGANIQGRIVFETYAATHVQGSMIISGVLESVPE